MRYIAGMPVNGVVLKSPDESHAAEMIDLMVRILDETPFLSGSSGEFRISLQEERAFLRRRETDPRDCLIGAWLDGRLVGTASVAAVSDRTRLRHRAALGISVLREAWGRGVGTMLMDAAVQTAQAAGFRQLELEVAADNERAIRLYRRFDFAEYGRRPAGMRRDGVDVDEILMARSLV